MDHIADTAPNSQGAGGIEMVSKWIIKAPGEGGSPLYWGKGSGGAWGWLGGKSSAYQYHLQDEANKQAEYLLAYRRVLLDAGLQDEADSYTASVEEVIT
jgi:hypothetical protein